LFNLPLKNHTNMKKLKNSEKSNIFARQSITKKLIVNVVAGVALLNLIMVGFIGYQTASKGNTFANEVAIHRSEGVAMEVKNYVNQAIETTSTLTNTLKSLRASENIQREDIAIIFEQVLKTNSEYLAIWTLWEEDAFDGKDHLYRENTQYNATEGRMNLSLYKSGTNIEFEKPEIEDYQEDYYTEPKKKKAPLVTAPYHYSFNGDEADNMYITSIAFPIIENNKYLGVVGLDINLERLSTMVSNVSLYTTGKASVISNDLQIAAHQDPKLQGTNLTRFLNVERELSVESIQEGKSYILRDNKVDNLLKTFTPLYFNGIDEPWSVMVEVPLSEVNSALVLLLTSMAGILVISLILLSLIVLVIARNITRPIVRTIASVEEVAKGNLNTHILFTERNDEIGQLANSLKTLTDKLKEILGGVFSSADNVAAASQQMSSTAQQMSQGSTEQATSTEEVSSSMEQMAANISQNTENARETERIAQNVLSGMEKVGNRAKESLSSVKSIESKISIITEISRQTNILALNAAVEAARAGEHGKGFAVVAAEVRKLAEHSKKAADEIISLASNSVQVTEKAGELMQQIMPDLIKTTHLIQEVTAASIEQNAGAEQINSAIQQLNSVTQQNASASEELSASSEELAKQADQLLEMISYFKTDTNTAKKPAKNNHDRVSAKPHTNGWHKADRKATPQKFNNGFTIEMGDSLDSGFEKF
jgi:methyl-accepting chemotaxis protein